MTLTPSPTTNISLAFIKHARTLLVDEYLPKIERCLEQLTDEQVWWRANDDSNSVGNLLLHLSGNARQWIVSGLGDRPDHRDRDWEFAQREGITREDLRNKLRDTIAEVDSVLAHLDYSSMLELRQIQGNDVTVLEAVFHVTEHFSMHTGQIIYITKLLTSTDLNFYGFEGGVPSHRW